MQPQQPCFRGPRGPSAGRQAAGGTTSALASTSAPAKPARAALALALALGTAAAAAPTPLPAQQPMLSRDSAQVFLLTFGPGAAMWERFGHNALWIHDPDSRSDMAYHYGLFDMSESGFLTRFLQGRMNYSMGEADAGLLMDFYRRQGRDVHVQELDLDREQIRELDAFLRWNMRPENRRYRYDYFRDNCSTRIRDALDRVMDGRLQAELEARPTPVTWRSEALELTEEDVLLSTGMDIGLGPLADREISRWELAYIPMRLRDDVRTLEVERGGARAPLVRAERFIPAVDGDDLATDVAAPAALAEPAPPDWGRVLLHLLTGLMLGGLLAGAGHLAGTRAGGTGRVGAWVLAIAGGAWGLVAGILGLILTLLWLLTDHEFAYRNENLLQMNPLALGLAVLVPLAAWRGRATVAAAVLGAVLLALAIIGLLVHPLPLTGQANLAIIALALPVHAGLLYGVGALWRRGAGPAVNGVAEPRTS